MGGRRQVAAGGSERVKKQRKARPTTPPWKPRPPLVWAPGWQGAVGAGAGFGALVLFGVVADSGHWAVGWGVTSTLAVASLLLAHFFQPDLWHFGVVWAAWRHPGYWAAVTGAAATPVNVKIVAA